MSTNLEERVNPYQSPTSIEKPQENKILKYLPKIINTLQVVLTPGYTFYLQYQIERQDEIISDNSWQENLINEFPVCTLIEISKLYIFGVTIYAISQLLS